MAIGSLISNRNFGSFLGSGQALSHQRGPRSAPNAPGSIFFRKLQGQMTTGVASGFSYSPFLQVVGHSDEKIFNALATYPRQRRRRCECCLSSDNSIDHWLRPNGGQCRFARVNRLRAFYKPEEYDIPDTPVESLKSLEGSGEAVLVEGNVQGTTSPWWEQFPKRWVIVLLCFVAFLLCNMDRVNMSIAILPMSQEFNWNSATVGLIQSSFFWGYLLTQIVGGIWADKIGGKLVLGFGVVWWSVATILTPIAA
ncbi:hypothetical protein Tsubulata_047883, partial [Turnera subulata]